VFLLSVLGFGQLQSPLPRRPDSVWPQEEFANNTPSNTPSSKSGVEYRIGKDDLIEVTVFEDPTLNTASRVTASGTISLNLLGSIAVAGNTPQEVESLIENALKEKYINDPHATVFVREYASQPVSIMGAVKKPGIYQIKGQKSLLDMIAMAEGIDSLVAGKTIQILRHNALPDEDATSATGSRTIMIDTEELFDNGKTELNIPIMSGDVINVVRAGSIFVVGEVIHPNEFVLREGKNITVTQAIALANGTTKDAKKSACVIMRYHRNSGKEGDVSKEEIHIDYEKILTASSNDVTLLPNDILFVPANKVKSTLNRALESTITVAMGRLIYVGF
jgi:polysaccharide export outer membrane protein